MEQTKKKTSLWKKIVIGILVAILAIVLILGIAIYAMWHNEIATLSSMELIRERNDEHLDGDVYMMKVRRLLS